MECSDSFVAVVILIRLVVPVPMIYNIYIYYWTTARWHIFLGRHVLIMQEETKIIKLPFYLLYTQLSSSSLRSTDVFFLSFLTDCSLPASLHQSCCHHSLLSRLPVPMTTVGHRCAVCREWGPIFAGMRHNHRWYMTAGPFSGYCYFRWLHHALVSRISPSPTAIVAGIATSASSTIFRPLALGFNFGQLEFWSPPSIALIHLLSSDESKRSLAADHVHRFHRHHKPPSLTIFPFFGELTQ